MSDTGRKEMGKVARLPRDIRKGVNERLRDNRTLREIAEWLNGLEELQPWFAAEKFPPFNEENINNWRKGGHQEWLKAQDRFERLKLQAEARKAVRDQLAAEGVDPNEANTAALVDVVDDILSDFDPAALKQMAKDDPARVLRLVADITSAVNAGKVRVGELELKVRKFEDQIRAAQKVIDEAKTGGHGVSADTLARIERELKLL